MDIGSGLDLGSGWIGYKSGWIRNRIRLDWIQDQVGLDIESGWIGYIIRAENFRMVDIEINALSPLFLNLQII